MRCADTTSASCGTSNSSSASAAALITGQSESLPITMPTMGSAGARGTVMGLSLALGAAGHRDGVDAHPVLAGRERRELGEPDDHVPGAGRLDEVQRQRA